MKFVIVRKISGKLPLLMLLFAVAAQQDEHHTTIVIVHPDGQNVTLPFGLRQAVIGSNERPAWLIGTSQDPYEVNSLINGILTGYSADLHNNDLIIKNIVMNDNRNNTEYKSVIGTPGSIPNTLDVVESGNITVLYVAGVPGKVPNVNIANSSDGKVVNFTLTWREPVNHLDPIMMYNVSCSGDPPCPQSYNTSNNQTRSYTFTGFTANSYYTFSVVAINSIGSGEPGVVTVGDITITTIAPSVVTMSTATITTSCAGIMTTITTTKTLPTVMTISTTTIVTPPASSDCSNNGAIIGAIIVVCTVIIIMVIINIMVWIYCFRRRHHTGTSSELYKPTNDTINPAYHAITDDYKISIEEPNYYEEVNVSPKVKLIPDLVYAAP